MNPVEDTLYRIIAECLNVLIEEFDSGDIDMPEFCAKVERIFGKSPVNVMNPEMGLEWEMTQTGYNLYYVAAGHTATLRASFTDDGKFVHGVIRHIDVEAEAPPAGKYNTCGNKECVTCDPPPPVTVEFLMSREVLNVLGRLSMDEN